jgi:hypothetical protein
MKGTPRFAAWHIGDTGFGTLEEVEKWIANCHDPENYYPVATIEDLPKEIASELEIKHNMAIQTAVRRAVQAERKRLANLLGL